MDAHERPRDSEDDERNDKQDEAELEQRVQLQRPPARLREFVGDGRGDRRARRKERCRDARRIADDEGHRHGLAERAAEPEHHAADEAVRP